ncbi:MAG: phage tail protein [Cyanobacteria bacterium P01_D01_bin.44]
MATSVKDIQDKYPIPVFYYRVTIGDNDSIAFSEVSGLNFQYETITYKDGLSYKDGPKYMPGFFNVVNLTLQKGVVKADNFLLNWFKTIRLNTVEKRDVRIDLLNENGDATASWLAKDAFPTKLDAPSFNASSNEVAIESLELTATWLEVSNPAL